MQEPSRPTATAPVHRQSAEMELDDDELLDMMGDMHPDSPPQPLLPANRPPITNTLAGKHIINAAKTLLLIPKLTLSLFSQCLLSCCAC